MFLANDAARLRKVFVGSGNTDEETEVYVRLLSRPGALTAALNWYRAMALSDVGDSLPSVVVPTMYIWSTDDIALSREAAELTAQFVDGPYRFEILEEINHWVPEHGAQQLNQLFREHFASFRS
jgi:pimeloyl-ACP methyl ester carboxylesterase